MRTATEDFWEDPHVKLWAEHVIAKLRNIHSWYRHARSFGKPAREALHYAWSMRDVAD